MLPVQLHVSLADQEDFHLVNLIEDSGAENVIVFNNTLQEVTLTGLAVTGYRSLTLINKGTENVILTPNSPEAESCFRFLNGATLGPNAVVTLLTNGNGWTVIGAMETIVSASESGTPAATDLIPYVEITAPVGRVVRVTFPEEIEADTVISLGGQTLTEGVDFAGDNGTAADNVADFLLAVDEELIPALSFLDNTDGTFDINFDTGSESNAIEFQTTDEDVTFEDVAVGTDETRKIKQAEAGDIGGSGILTSYLDADVTYNNTDTLAATALSVTVTAGGKYEIELTVHSTSAVKALVMDFGGTATFTNFIGQWLSIAVVPGDFAHGLGVTLPGTDYFDATIDGGGAGQYYTFKGSCEVNAGGTFLLRGAQNAADASDSKILAGSVLKLTPLT